MTTIAIVEYGTGNHRSVLNALRMVAPAARAVITRDRQTILEADRVILPGQGAMHSCMASLKTGHLHDTLLEAARNKPFLGICIGLQMLFEHSDEGQTPGLGLIKGDVHGLRPSIETAARAQKHAPTPTNSTSLFKIPHMGWNQVHQTQAHPLWEKIAQDTAFYFVHSYYVEPTDAKTRTAETSYGITFTSAVAQDNIFAVQFHPEKSATAGLQLFRNFVDWNL